MDEKLVHIDEYGLLGSNFYWKHRDKIDGASDDDLREVGLENDRVLVHREIIDILIKIDREFQKSGYRTYVKEGLRSKELYKLVYRKRVEIFGKERTDALFNMKEMPHATGKTVDIALWDKQGSKEVYLRDGEDGDDAYFANFYRDKTDEDSKRYQSLQNYLIGMMQDHGFRLGKRKEYFHFDYKPDIPRNY
jgi:D-alanyl-D-alanine dipeptidase